MRSPSLSRAARLAVVAGAAALLLSACTAGNTSKGSGSDVSGTITYAFWNSSQKPAIQKEVAAFEKKYPKVKVTLDLTPFGSYFTKLQTQGQSGALPDVFWMNNDDLALYASNGLLAQTPSSIDLSRYSSSAVDSYKYDGKLYGVPSFQAGLGVWYNKAILKEAGVSAPTANWTWADFQRDAKAVSDALKSKGIFGEATDLSDGNATYYPTILQAGGYVVSGNGKKAGYDTSAGESGLQFWRDLIANGSSPSLQQLADTADIDYFTSGKSAFFWGISSYADTMASSKIASDIAVAPLPQGKIAANIVNANANEMSAKSKNPAAAKAFLAFLAGSQAQTILASVTWPALSGEPQTVWKKRYPFDMQVFVDAEKISKQPYPNLTTTAQWQQAEQALMPSLLSGTTPVDTAAKQITAKVDDILAK